MSEANMRGTGNRVSLPWFDDIDEETFWSTVLPLAVLAEAEFTGTTMIPIVPTGTKEEAVVPSNVMCDVD